MKRRYFNTEFWSDGFIVELTPIERYLFLYFLINEHTNISGIYELPLKVIVFETQLSEEKIGKCLKKFDKKIYYKDGWVFVKNFAKHQVLNDSVMKGIDNLVSKLPRRVSEWVQTAMGVGTDGDIFRFYLDLDLDSIKYIEVSKNIKIIFNFWNNQKIVEHKKLTDKMKTKINSALKEYSLEDIKKSISNYSTVLSNKKYFWSYKWTLEDFLVRGLTKFLDVPLKNYETEESKKLPPLPDGWSKLKKEHNL